MSDPPPPDSASSPTEPSPVESTLARLAREVATVDDKDQGAVKKGKQTSLPWALIIAGIIAVIVAVLGFGMVLARRKAAKLQHEKNVKEEEALQAKERASTAEHEAEREKLEARAEKLLEEVEQIEMKRGELETVRLKFEEEVRALTSWGDVEVIDGRS